MTLSQFLDAAYYLLVEEFRRLGASLAEALERTREYAAGGHRRKQEEPVITAGGNAPVREMSPLSAEELQNEASLAALEVALAGVGGVR